MIVIFPIGHEEGRTWRFPYITVGLIVICALVLAFTQGAIKDQEKLVQAAENRLAQFKVQVFIMRQMEKGDLITAIVDEEAGNYLELVKSFGKRLDEFWAGFTTGRIVPDSDPMFQQYLQLNYELGQAKKSNIAYRFGLVPNRVTFLTLFTSMFLHADIGHLLMNMIFLFLAGFALEDVWGRMAFVLFYLSCGLAAGAAHIAMNLGSEVPCIGASGAIAGLMGGFLVRFFRVKIHFAYYYFLLRFHFGRFSMPSFIALPAWLGIQLLYASLTTGGDQAIAYWAHIGGFGFGMAGALVLVSVNFGAHSVGEAESKRYETLKKTPVTDLSKGREMALNGNPAASVNYFDKILVTNPGNLSVKKERLFAFFEMGDETKVKADATALINAFIAAENVPAAVEILDATLMRFPQMEMTPTILFKAATFFEGKWENEKAVDYYLNAAEPGGPIAGNALLAAAKIIAVRLRNPDKAAKIYQRIIDELPNDPVAPIARERMKK